MHSEESQETSAQVGPAPLVVPLVPRRASDDPSGEISPEAEANSPSVDGEPSLEVSTEECMITSISSHPSNGFQLVDPVDDDVDIESTDKAVELADDEGEIIGLMLVTPTVAPEEGAADGAVDAAYSVLGKASLDEVKALEAKAVAAQSETDPAILRQRAMDALMRSEEEAHDIIETAQRDASSRTTRADLKAKLTLDQARERADLLIASAHLRSELLVEEACKTAVFDIEQETRVQCDVIIDEAKAEAKTRLHGAADEARDIVDRARRQGDEIVAAAEFDAEERRRAAADMFATIESLEQKVEEDARLAADASAAAATEVLDQANRDADGMRYQAAIVQEEARTQAEVIVRNAHTRSEQIIAGADETAAWFSERVQARETNVREATEAHVNDMLERAEGTSLELLLNARERCTEMIAAAQVSVDRMLMEGRRVAQDLVGSARSEAASEGMAYVEHLPPPPPPPPPPPGAMDEAAIDQPSSVETAPGSFAGLWNHSVDDEALDDFFSEVAERSEGEVFSP